MFTGMIILLAFLPLATACVLSAVAGRQGIAVTTAISGSADRLPVQKDMMALAR